MYKKSKFKSIQKVEKKEVYDIFVLGKNCYYANGILVHNSTKPSINQAPEDFREFVRPDSGKIFWYFDLSAAELYIVFKLSGQIDMVEAYERGEDLHKIVAGKLLAGMNIDIPEGKTDRDISKTVAFAVIYGSKGYSIARRLKCSENKAIGIVDYFFQLYPKVRIYRDAVIEEFHKTGLATTIIGRPRIILGRDDHADRQAFNTKIQSSLADYAKYIMVRLAKILKEYDSRVVVSIFDSFLLEIPISIDKSLVKMIIDGVLFGMKMKFNYKLNSGFNWKEAAA